ncbi:MAG: 1,4-alpha-glucan branching protein GlgB [Gammaproteobacteria bacterium]|nr:1,4-alpha-glucan branching protein GlgB [Gammaproteobacteria bacterium]
MLLTERDIYLFREGTHFRAHEVMGAHPGVEAGKPGTLFRVWAPNARGAAVIGDFNEWRPQAAHALHSRDDQSGIWERFVPGIEPGARYKYRIAGARGESFDKSDPYAVRSETPPGTASIVWNLDYAWGDGDWMARRAAANALDAPCAVYEVHLGSWRRHTAPAGAPPGYRETAHALADYVTHLGFTHVELMPIMEHPFYGSWGYQVTSWFAPTGRYGTPQDLMTLIDVLHQRGIGVILDWVPSHFPQDGFGLVYFDGTQLYEHADRRQGFQPEWNSYVFNYGRAEVRDFLGSSAMFWLQRYHADALRVDAVASMLYLDYSRPAGEWIPNRYGGNENLEAIAFIKTLNEQVYQAYPDTQTIAEESTAWPQVSRPVYRGGLGFGMKWNMGWMHDTLAYFAEDPLFRKYHQDKLTFGLWYAFSENFMLPLSHDEVVYGKGSLLSKMSGDSWQQFANLRALFGFMWAHPGKKLLFMGGEFAQRAEWNHDESLHWGLLDDPAHAGVQRWVRDLNTFYRGEPALHRYDFAAEGFEWIDCRDAEHSVFAFLRKSHAPADTVLVVLNLTPVARENYRIGVPAAGTWRECLNSDASLYGGSGRGNGGHVESVPLPAHGRYQSLSLELPPLSALYFKRA